MSVNRIAARSPYYKEVALVSPLTGATCTEFTIKLYIWSGLASAVPVSATYELTRTNYEAGTGTDNVEIGRIIKGEIDVSLTELTLAPSGSISDSYQDNQVWVKSEVYYTTSDPLDNGIAQDVETECAFMGWNNGFEDINTLVPENIQQTNRIVRIKRDREICIPIMNPISIPGTAYPFTIISYPTNSINVSSTLPASDKSEDLTRYVAVDPSEASPSDLKIVLEFNNRDTVTFVFDDDARYDQTDIYFINKFGAQETIPMRRQRNDSLNVTQEEYSGSYRQPANGFHQVNQFNVNGKSGIKLSSGYLPETSNESFKELLLSEKVWLYDGTDVRPVTIKTTSLAVKTVRNEKLINYEIEFENAYFEINNI